AAVVETLVSVVGAVNGDRHHLFGAVSSGHLESVDERIAVPQRLNHTVVVVELVAPYPLRRHREGTVTAITRRAFDRCKGIVCIVDICIGERSGRNRFTATDASSFRAFARSAMAPKNRTSYVAGLVPAAGRV